jgi:hypothetical protein
MRFEGRILALLVVVAGVAACGLPGDGQVTTYNPNDLPDRLVQPTTTSTTTTTLAPPPTDAPPDDASTTTSTVLPLETEPVEVFYTRGFSDDLQRVTLNRPSPISIEELTELLESPPPEVTSFNLRSSLRSGLIVDVVPDRGTATIELSQDVLNSMTSSQERRAIAQIVLTLTSFDTGSGGLGQVRFTVDDEPIPVFLPAQDGDSEPGELVAYSDFGVLVTPTAPTTTTTTTSTTTTTTTTTTTAPAESPSTSSP